MKCDHAGVQGNACGALRSLAVNAGILPVAFRCILSLSIAPVSAHEVIV